MESAPGCWALYGELLARLLSDPRAEDVRRRCVDAFAVQHPGTPGPQAIQSVAGHLMSLYAQFELGESPRRAYAIIEVAVRAKDMFRWLTPPTSKGCVTVGAVLAHSGPLDEAAREWASEAWQAWSTWHGQIRDWHRVLAAMRPSARESA
jgi:hypothetical protein